MNVLLDRDEIDAAEAMPPHVHAMLRNLAGLPHLVETLEGEVRRASR